MHNDTEKFVNKMTFEEAINNTRPEDRLLLLGNGFSRSLYTKLNYQTLRDTAIQLSTHNKLSSELVNIFDDLNTDDFEKVLAYLNIAKRITNHYKNELSQRIDADIQQIRHSFIASITEVHPSADILSNETKLSVCKFLSKFSKIFTTNYDLLLYWICMESKSNFISCPINDGFGLFDPPDINDLGWIHPEKQNFYYLHGALHLFDDSYGNVFKLRRDNNISLRNQIFERISNGSYPLVIFEGKHQQKLEKINRHEYFWHSYNTLKNANGSLFTLGTSLNKHSDHHIIDAIKNSKIDHAFIGIYKEDLNLYENACSLQGESKKVDFFDSGTAIDWGVVQKDF